jgi:hypothetical protein
MRKTGATQAVVGIIICITITACGSGMRPAQPSVNEAVLAGVAATLTKEAWLDGVESARKTSIAGENATQMALTDSGGILHVTATGTQEPTQTITPEPHVVVHQDLPGEPWEIVSTYLTDYNSSDYKEEGYTYGEDFNVNRLERPFTSENMEYRGYLDIIRVNLKNMGDWFYVIIYLAEDLPESGEVRYGIELDMNENGRGDFLIVTNLPQSPDWSVNNVKIYHDKDGDVGGENALRPDKPDPELTGFEEIIFDSGQGEDPDIAWSRRNPDESNSLQIAFKNAFVGFEGYMWSVWADEGLRAPNYFDYNDYFTIERAGSPYPESPLYPIKALYLVDSTCRSYFGFTPTGKEPGICP